MQPSQEFVSCSSNLYNVNPCMSTGLGGRSDVRARGFAREQQVRGLQPGYWGGQSFGGENRNFLLNDNTYQITDTSTSIPVVTRDPQVSIRAKPYTFRSDWIDS